MKEWLLIFLVFIVLIILIVCIGWIDWKFKGRKTARENKFNSYVVGYAIFKSDDNGQSILILDGLLGVNSNELVFGNRFKDDAITVKEEFQNICYFNVSEYDENDFLRFVHKNCDGKVVKTKYVVRNMAGISIYTRIPKLIRTRMICKIGFANNGELYFCYKNTKNNVDAIENFKNIFV